MRTKEKNVRDKLLRVAMLFIVFAVFLSLVWGAARLITVSITPDTVDVMFVICVSVLFGFMVGKNGED